ncbi:MAG: hypothetical protein IJ072_08350 [Oscillospiraceae bacterium]|nr:hypothetical protein [Oscillospiraceae bacterium]
MTGSGFSRDGYIIDQGRMKSIPYGKFNSDWNGCGWIAVYNLMHALEFDVTPQQVHKLCAQALPLGGFIGTPVKTVVGVLELFDIKVRLVRGKKRVSPVIGEFSHGILRFFDGKYDHYVAFTDAGSGMYRFFNSDTERETDIMTMDRFLRLRCKGFKLTLIGVVSHP